MHVFDEISTKKQISKDDPMRVNIGDQRILAQVH